jgi:hypothetical protein
MSHSGLITENMPNERTGERASFGNGLDDNLVRKGSMYSHSQEEWCSDDLRSLGESVSSGEDDQPPSLTTMQAMPGLF